MKKIIYIFLVFGFIYLTGCNNSSSPNITDALKLNISDLTTSPNYAGFAETMKSYNPDTNMINQIKILFDTNVYRCYFYADFSCGCVNQQTDIARLIKVLQSAKISENYFEIYSMRKTTFTHPHMSELTISSLPAGFLMKNSSPSYSLIDTITINSFLGKGARPDSLMLEALKK